MATVLFVGGTLMHSFVKLARVEVGYDPANVLTFQVGVPVLQRPVAELKTFAEQLAGRLRSNAVTNVSRLANQLLSCALKEVKLQIERPPNRRPIRRKGLRRAGADARLVSADYLRTMGIRVIAGRPFDERDGASAPRVRDHQSHARASRLLRWPSSEYNHLSRTRHGSVGNHRGRRRRAADRSQSRAFAADVRGPAAMGHAADPIFQPGLTSHPDRRRSVIGLRPCTRDRAPAESARFARKRGDDE